MNIKIIIFSLVLVFYSIVGAQVLEWGQCGGKDYNGPTQCAPGIVVYWLFSNKLIIYALIFLGLECVYGGEWWSSCKKCSGGIWNFIKKLVKETDKINY